MDTNSENKRRNTSNERSEETDLPGYPHYPSEDDIMNPSNGLRKVDTDVEDLANSKRLSSRAATDGPNPDDNVETPDDDDLAIVKGTEADVTDEDIALLGPREGDQDFGDDELVKGNSRVDEIEEEDEDLDIPGAELDDSNESLGEEDEENNYYSLGGDRHESLEEERPDQDL